MKPLSIITRAIDIIESENYLDLFVLSVYVNYALFLAENDILIMIKPLDYWKKQSGEQKMSLEKDSRDHVI